METIRQIRIAVVGMPDAGKSTFIKSVLETMGRHLQPDTLMQEVHWSDGRDPYGNPDTRTIKCAKIQFKYKDVEFCFYDCPGHKEYDEQINQGLGGAHGVIRLIDNKRYDESQEYFEGMEINKPMLTLYSHSNNNWFPHYDAESNGFKNVANIVLEHFYNELKSKAVDVEQEALDIIKDTIKGNTIMFFSGGKDSIVGLHLLKTAGMMDKVKVYYPNSGYDFKEVADIIEYYKNEYDVDIELFDNSLGRTYDTHSSFEMMSAKAEANNVLIDAVKADIVCVQYRASDEGVRSKDYHINDRGTHKRFSPVFYFSETNIWRYISKHDIKVCDLYFKGYRSLGDEPVTVPCMSEMQTVDEIINWIDSHPETTERDGRTKQDKAEKFTMERLRNNGFF